MRIRGGCAAFALALTLAACKRGNVETAKPAVEEAPTMASTVRMADAKTAPQLLSGFYGVENNAWRWTAKQFVVQLRPPAGASTKGAVLDLRLTVPAPVIEKLGGTTLTASINGTALPPDTYNKPGDYDYKREIAPALLAGDSVRIDFQLDKAMPPGDADVRELGIVVLRVGLESK